MYLYYGNLRIDWGSFHFFPQKNRFLRVILSAELKPEIFRFRHLYQDIHKISTFINMENLNMCEKTTKA